MENLLKIEPIETKKSGIEQRPLMDKKIIPTHPSSVLFVGKSASGKSVLMANLLSKKQFYKDYFDYIFLFSKAPDDILDIVKIPKKRIYLNPKPDQIQHILDISRECIEKMEDISKCPKILIIFEDCISDVKLQNSDSFLQCFIANRHYNVSVWITTQSYTRVVRPCRLQANNIFDFRGGGSENELIAQEYMANGLKSKYSFLHINNKADIEQRYCRNLDEIIQLN
jgi:hypothetical protein